MTTQREAELEELLRGADIVPLAISLVHLTGDLSILEEIAPFIRGPWDYMQSVPEGIKAGLVARARAELIQLDEGGAPRLPMPDTETLRHMMSVAVGQEVGADYVSMLMQQMSLGGEESRDDIDDWRADPKVLQSTGFRVLIVGAGLSGICAAIKLQSAGIPYTILEKNDSAGGTWFENRYPGCAVDTPNHFYQFSFEPNNEWPNYYSQQPNILEYITHCVEKYGLRPNIRFRSEVTSATYDAARQLWTVCARNEQGEIQHYEAQAVITAVGQLNRPAIPDLPGLDSFSGEVTHTATWTDTTSVAGKRVALVGTGASGVQIGPNIAGEVDQLFVLQRSGSWIVRNSNYLRRVEEPKKWALNNVPFYGAWYRFQLFWAFGDGLFPALKIDPDWQGDDGSISALNARYREAMVRYMSKELEGREDLLAKAMPTYPPYGKRALADAGWFKMLRRDNVHLITTPIERVSPDAIHLKDGSAVPVDAIVFATGFQAGKILWPMTIKGRSGRTIRELWGDDDPRAYLGIAVPDFPNLFVLYGPNTNVGHGGSAIFLAECQVRYTMKSLRAMLTEGIGALECRQDVHDAYNERIDQELRQLVWSHPSVGSWYKNDKGRIITNQPWTLLEYWRLTREPNLREFHREPRTVAGEEGSAPPPPRREGENVIQCPTKLSPA